MATETPLPIRYSGDLKIGHWNTLTEFGGYDEPINVQEFTIESQTDAIVVPNMGTENFGQVKHVFYQSKPSKITFQVDEFSMRLLADLIRGLYLAFSQSAQTAIAVTKTLIQDKWVDLGEMNVGNVAITGKVLGTDFQVDPFLGQIMALNTATAGSQSITYDRGAVTGSKIEAGSSQPIILAAKGRVKNHNSGETGIIEVPRFAIDPKTGLMIVNTKNQEGKFDGMVLVPYAGPLYTFWPQLTMTPVV